MPRPGRLKGTGFRTYLCEDCGHEERLSYLGIGFEKECPHCGGVSYCDPFPDVEMAARLDRLGDRLEHEDGPLGLVQ